MARLEARLVRLERCVVPLWEAWIGRSPDDWPDEALASRIREGAGLAADVELTNEILREIAQGADGRSTPERGGA